MKKRTSLLLALVCGVAMAAPAFAGSTIKCIAVGTTATPLFTPRADRLSYSIWTTSGAGTIYFNDAGGTPVVPADANSAPLVGGQSYTLDRSQGTVTRAINVVGKSGAANWICGKEGT